MSNQKEMVSWKDIVNYPEKYDGDCLVQEGWWNKLNIFHGEIQIDKFSDSFKEMDTFLVTALMHMTDEKIKLTDEQREQIIERPQNKTGNFIRFEGRGGWYFRR